MFLWVLLYIEFNSMGNFLGESWDIGFINFFWAILSDPMCFLEKHAANSVKYLLGCPRKLGSMVSKWVITYEWGILGLQPIDPNHLLTSWDIQSGGNWGWKKNPFTWDSLESSESTKCSAYFLCLFRNAAILGPKTSSTDRGEIAPVTHLYGHL